jgi:dienelactone hydrolase
MAPEQVAADPDIDGRADMRRTIDYLDTRPDIDSKELAYFGVSWGGYLGGIMPAVEPRIKAVILYVAGLEMERVRPESRPDQLPSAITAAGAHAEREV